MGEEGFAAAKVIYEEGGNSKVSATMSFLTGSKWPISPGTILYGAGTTGLIVSGSGSSSGGPPTDADFSVTVKYAGGTCQSFNDDKSKCFAEKRGGDFGTEVGDVSQVNSDLADLFAKGRDHFDAAQCEAAGKTLKKVKRIIYIPLIQGALKYA